MRSSAKAAASGTPRQQPALTRRQLEQRCRTLEKERRAAEAANQAKSLFLANLSHEIRTPMNAILGYGQILLRAPDLSPKHRMAVSTIARSGAHLLALINEVLDLAKIEAGCMELHTLTFDLNALIYDVSAMFQLRCNQKKLNWVAEIWHPPGVLLDRAPLPGEFPAGQDQREMAALRILVKGDERKLRQVLINLLSNAVNFTASGDITLRVSLPAAHGGASEQHHHLFEVIDTGPGIPPQAQAELFQPFYQGASSVTAGGTGLGLVIAKRLVDLMGGVLRFESKLGTGSRFHFSVPLLPVQATAESPESDTQIRRLRPGTTLEVLVVDDVLENREVLSHLLRDLGCRVEMAASGAEAIERIQSRLPQVVFMDIRMPGMDGIEAARRIQRQVGREETKIVALSASVLAHEQKACLARGFDYFVAKPFRVDSICRCLTALVGVAFESDLAPVPAQAQAVSGDVSVAIPGELLARIEAAAEIYNTTELKRCLAELNELRPSARALAATLLGLMRRYDMDGIRRILATTRVPAATSPPAEPTAAN